MRRNSKRYKKKNVYLNGEPLKDRFVIQTLPADCYPDLVMHEYVLEKTEGGEDYKLGEQCWLCEIKMSSNKKWRKDLRKLTELCRKGELNFKHYIFLFVGITFDIFIDKMKSLPPKLCRDIYIVWYCDGVIEYVQLKDLLQEET